MALTCDKSYLISGGSDHVVRSYFLLSFMVRIASLVDKTTLPIALYTNHNDIYAVAVPICCSSFISLIRTFRIILRMRTLMEVFKYGILTNKNCQKSDLEFGCIFRNTNLIQVLSHRFHLILQGIYSFREERTVRWRFGMYWVCAKFLPSQGIWRKLQVWMLVHAAIWWLLRVEVYAWGWDPIVELPFTCRYTNECNRNALPRCDEYAIQFLTCPFSGR